ncbi:MAG: metallophosphoesterase family protein [Anaerolineae bacterium]|nr:metallophosphoesterase family protein [Anaerolineae bacterium]
MNTLMKILALSDRIVEANHSPQLVERYGDVDLVIGCGDLPYYYLEYIATMLPVPVLYVHGNHDKPTQTANRGTLDAPGGCISLDGRCMSIERQDNDSPLLLAGLGGSMSYNRKTPHQYTEIEMRARALKLLPSLMANRARYGRALDILVTHSPPFGIHDGEDLPHIGFKVFLSLMRTFKPRYLLHGHTHIYRLNTVSTTNYEHTKVTNVYPSTLIEWNGGR